MSVVEMLAFGTTVGVAHSFEADHLAAVASLVEDERDARPGLVGTSWGVGHALPIAAVGGLFLLAGARLPDLVATVAEALAGLALVVIGARVALLGLETTRHTHDGDTHAHVSLGPIDLGTTHSHHGGESFVVGILHGLAGSGVAIGGLATGATLVEGVSLLGAFAVASILTMGVVSVLWGRVLSLSTGRALQTVAGAAAIVIGLSIVVEQVLAGGL